MLNKLARARWRKMFEALGKLKPAAARAPRGYTHNVSLPGFFSNNAKQLDYVAKPVSHLSYDSVKKFGQSRAYEYAQQLDRLLSGRGDIGEFPLLEARFPSNRKALQQAIYRNLSSMGLSPADFKVVGVTKPFHREINWAAPPVKMPRSPEQFKLRAGHYMRQVKDITEPDNGIAALKRQLRTPNKKQTMLENLNSRLTYYYNNPNRSFVDSAYTRPTAATAARHLKFLENFKQTHADNPELTEWANYWISAIQNQPRQAASLSPQLFATPGVRGMGMYGHAQRGKANGRPYTVVMDASKMQQRGGKTLVTMDLPGQATQYPVNRTARIAKLQDMVQTNRFDTKNPPIMQTHATASRDPQLRHDFAEVVRNRTSDARDVSDVLIPIHAPGTLAGESSHYHDDSFPLLHLVRRGSKSGIDMPHIAEAVDWFPGGVIPNTYRAAADSHNPNAIRLPGRLLQELRKGNIHQSEYVVPNEASRQALLDWLKQFQ